MTKHDREQFRDEISRLYLTENRTLLEVQKAMKDRHGFKASTSWYRKTLREWGFLKNRALEDNDGFIHPPMTSPSSAVHDLPFSRKRPLSLLSSGDSGHHSIDAILPPSPRLDTSSPPWSAVGTWTKATTIEQTLGTIVDTEKTTRSPPRDLALSTGRFRNANQESVSFRKNEIGAITDLHRAAETGDQDLVRKLVQRGTDVNVRDSQGRSPLSITICQDPIQDTIVEILLDNGADPNILNIAGDSPFHLLAERAETVDHDSLVLMCLEHGADPHTRNSRGLLPLELYIERWWERLKKDPISQIEKRIWLELLETFFKKGASPDVALAPGEYLCHGLIRTGIFEDSSTLGPNKAPFGILLCQWSSPALRDLYGNTTLHLIVERPLNSTSIRALQILLDREGDPNSKNSDGFAPLLLLLRSNRTGDPFIRMASDILMKNGADPLEPDPSGEIPVGLAAASEFAEDRYSLLRAMLTWIGDSSHEISDRERLSFWPEFRRAYHTAPINWSGKDREILCSPSPSGYKVNLIIAECTKIVLYERALKNLENSALGKMDENGKRVSPERPAFLVFRKRIVDILRTCRSEDIEIDPKCYQVLLDLEE